MIHAACSNSNHLQTRQKPDTDKGWRDQCRLGTASLLIPSASQSEHLGYQERGLLPIQGRFCLPGLPGKMWSRALYKRKQPGGNNAWPPSPAPRTSLPGAFLIFQAHLEEQWLSPALDPSLCNFYQKAWNLSVWLTHSSKLAQVMLCSTLEEGRNEWDLADLVQLLPKPEWKWTRCQYLHTQRPSS